MPIIQANLQTNRQIANHQTYRQAVSHAVNKTKQGIEKKITTKERTLLKLSRDFDQPLSLNYL